MPSRRRIVLALAVPLAALSAIACKRAKPPAPEPPAPTERVLVVEADPGPGLRKPGAHQHSDRTTRKGDVLTLVQPSATVEWSDVLEEERLNRAGAMLEVKRAPGEASLFVWASDVRRDVPVVTASYFCSKLPGATWAGLSCEQALLRRALPDGTTVGFVPCAQGLCTIVIAGARGAAATQIDGLDDVRVARLGATELVIASKHSSSEAKTGQELLVFDTSLKQLALIPVVEADPSKPEVLVWQVGWWKVSPEGLRVKGERAVVERATNKRLETTMIDDVWALSPQGAMERRAAAPVGSR